MEKKQNDLKLNFTYIFNEHIDRIWEIFSKYSILGKHIINDFLTYVHFKKGSDISEEGAEFQFKWGIKARKSDKK